MSKPRKIKIPAGLGLMAGTILQPDRPEAETLKEMIFAMVLDSEEEIDLCKPALRSLVEAYTALLEQGVEYARYEDEEVDDVETVGSRDDWAAENVYREFCIKGWRATVKREYPEAVASRDDADVYESCTHFDYLKGAWPVQLIAEVGYIIGVRDGKQGIAMTRYYEQERAGA